ncbi:MAG: hypothetical protein AAGA91_00375 [Pseudomonadota bacterium]
MDTLNSAFPDTGPCKFMDAILVAIGVLGIGAIVVSAWVFMVAARNYVSEDNGRLRRREDGSPARDLIERSTSDRRSGHPVSFPLMVNGILIEKDRRVLPDRRSSVTT